jgi:hypothetical protein
MKWLMVCVVFLVSCASVTYTPETGILKYVRVGNQQLENVVISKVDDNVTIQLGCVDSETKIIKAAVRAYRLRP